MQYRKAIILPTNLPMWYIIFILLWIYSYSLPPSFLPSTHSSFNCPLCVHVLHVYFGLATKVQFKPISLSLPPSPFPFCLLFFPASPFQFYFWYVRDRREDWNRFHLFYRKILLNISSFFPDYFISFIFRHHSDIADSLYLVSTIYSSFCFLLPFSSCLKFSECLRTNTWRLD